MRSPCLLVLPFALLFLGVAGVYSTHSVGHDARCLGGLVDAIGHACHFHHVAHLGHRDVGEAAAGKAYEDIDVLRPRIVVWIVDAHANAVETVVVAVDERGGQFGVCALLADGGAVFAVERDVEDGAKGLLQGERFAHQFFCARVVVADRQLSRKGIVLEQNLGRVHGVVSVVRRLQRLRLVQNAGVKKPEGSLPIRSGFFL